MALITGVMAPLFSVTNFLLERLYFPCLILEMFLAIMGIATSSKLQPLRVLCSHWISQYRWCTAMDNLLSASS